MKRLAAGIVLLLLAACGTPGLEAGSPSDSPSPYPAPVGQRYEFNGTVLQDSKHGPELCSGVALSLPPQCGGVPTVGWDWDQADGEERRGGTIWGEYRVVGTYDGKAFTLTERPGPVRRPDPAARIGSACTEPAGGWKRPDPDQTTDQAMQSAFEYAGKQPGSAGLWLSGDTPVDEHGVQNVSKAVLNFGFTGDLDRHETEIRKHWGGAVCLVKRDRSIEELRRNATEVHSYADSIGLDVSSSAANETTWVIEIGVFFADAAAQKRMDERFPDLAVKLDGVITPVD